MKDIFQDPFWKGLAKLGESCEFLRLRWAVSTAFHTGPVDMDKTATSMEFALSPRNHLLMTMLEIRDFTETSLLNCEVPAPRTGHYTVIANHKCEPESSNYSSQGYRMLGSQQS